MRKELFDDNAYAQLIEAHAKLRELVGEPPFVVSLARRSVRRTPSPSSAVRSSSSPAKGSSFSVSRDSAR
jgi:hypothetical protein